MNSNSSDRTDRRVLYLPLRNPYFVGRDELIKRIRDEFTSVNYAKPVHIITGIGGIGKIQVAIEYAYRNFREGYERILWIQSDTPEILSERYASLAAGQLEP